MKTTRKIIAIFWVICTVVLFVLGIWYAKKEFDAYVQKTSEKKQFVQFLEKNKESFELYKKILVKGSTEQDEIKKYVLSSNTSFAAISRIEADMQKAGLATKERGGLMSVTPREDAKLTAQGAREIIVELEADGTYQRVNDYIQALNSLPYVSYIEKVNIQFLEKLQTTVSAEGPVVKARIFLIVIETSSSNKKTE